MIPQEPFAGIHLIPGTIEAENYDLGGQGNAYYDNDTENQGGLYREDGVDIVLNNDNGYSVGYTEVGEWLEYTVSIKNEGLYTVEAKVSSGSDASSFRLFIDDTAITDTIKVANGGDWETYSVVSTKTTRLPPGPHILKLAITGSFFNIDWLKFTEGTNKISQKKNSLQLKGEQEHRIYNLNGVLRSKTETGVFLVRSANGSFSKLIDLKK